VPYVFDNLGALALYPGSSPNELVKEPAPDRRLAELTSAFLVNFARTGDPNGARLPAWEEHAQRRALKELRYGARPYRQPRTPAKRQPSAIGLPSRIDS
jgi:carboxylesterase type B